MQSQLAAYPPGTAAGDRVEIESMSQVFNDAGAVKHGCAIGSVKSMIGHTKSTAGLASMMKATLAEILASREALETEEVVPSDSTLDELRALGYLQ